MGGSGFYHVLLDTITPPPAALYALPMDNDVDPSPGPPWGVRNYFIVPTASTLSQVHVQGDTAAYGSVNTVNGAAAAPPAVRSHNIASSGTASVPSQTVVLASVLAGSSVYVAIEHDSPGPLASVTDSEGNNYALGTFQSFVNLVIEWWYKDNVSAAGPLTITATGASDGHLVVEAIELTGTDPVNSLDATGSGPPNSNSDTVTPLHVNDLCLLKVADLNDAGSYTAIGGSTLIDSNTGDGGLTQPIAAADLSQPGAGAGVPVTISANFSGAQTPGQYGALAIAVKASPGPALPIDIDLYIDGVFNSTLVTIPPGASTFDVFASLAVPIPANAQMQFIVDLTSWASGEISRLLCNFAITY